MGFSTHFPVQTISCFHIRRALYFCFFLSFFPFFLFLFGKEYEIYNHSLGTECGLDLCIRKRSEEELNERGLTTLCYFSISL